MRIVGYCEAAILLGLGLAAANIAPASAQTTVVGGDGRPAVVVDHSVLETLGPQPTLPDLLLGRQPPASGGATVKLHRPTGNGATAAAKAPKLTKPKAVAVAAPKLKEPPNLKEPKVAKAKPTKSEIKTAGDGDSTKMKASKKLATNFEPPPKPTSHPSAANSNADMPGATVESEKPAPAASAPSKSSSATTPAPEKLTAEKPVANAASTPAPVKTEAPKPPPEPAKVEAPKPEPAKMEAPKTESAKTESPKAESKVALLTPPPTTATTADGGAALTIPFTKDGASLSDDARGALVNVAKHALGDSAIQLQVLAYASGDEDSASKARRLSLSRALAVRSFLIDQGVHSTRIEVRALGNKVPDGPPDRVDLVEQKH